MYRLQKRRLTHIRINALGGLTMKKGILVQQTIWRLFAFYLFLENVVSWAIEKRVLTTPLAKHSFPKLFLFFNSLLDQPPTFVALLTFLVYSYFIPVSLVLFCIKQYRKTSPKFICFFLAVFMVLCCVDLVGSILTMPVGFRTLFCEIGDCVLFGLSVWSLCSIFRQHKSEHGDG